jgi:hypothetical protein
MAQIVKLRRSSVSGQKPTNSNLQLGELALNTTDGKVFMAVSGSLGPTVEELISTNTVNTGSIHLVGSITSSNFTGSFKGDGSELYNISLSGVTNLITISGSIDNRLDVLEAYSGSQQVPTASFAFRTQRTDVYCKNVSGTQINKGTVVRITGSVGDNPLIGVASLLTEGQSANTLGIAAENIPNDSFGLVITEGVLTGVNTNGMTAGQLLFLGANGTFTTSYPVPPNHGVRLGEVLRVQQNQGSIYVRIDNGAELGESHDVYDTTTNSSYGDLLVKSGSVWVNSRSLNGDYAVTGSLTITQNLTVLGSSSLVYVTSSNLAVSASFISVNVFEPAERFGGLKVYDSGSSNATASLAWDSLHNHWVYQNASGSSYSGGMLLSGPRNSGSLGEEPNLISGRIVKSVGGDHIDVSIISETGTTITVGGNLVANSITGAFDFYGLVNRPTLVSGSSQIEITGTTGYSTFSGSLSSSIGNLSSSIATTTNNIESSVNSIELTTSSLNSYTSSNTTNINAIHTATSSLNLFTSSYNTGSFTGSFIGDGVGLYNIPASGVTGLQLDKILSGNASASIDNNGFYVNRDVYIDGTITAKEIHTDYVTSSVLFQSGSTKFGNTSDDTHQFTGSVYITGSIVSSDTSLVSGSSQIDITNTTGYSTFSSSIKNSIDNVTGSITNLSSSVKNSIDTVTGSITALSSSVKVRIDDVTGSITALSSSVKVRIDDVTGSITALSSSVKVRIDDVTGSITALSSSVKVRIDDVTGSITTLSSSVKNSIDTVTGSITSLSSSVKNSIDTVTGSITSLSSSVKNSFDTITGSITSLSSSVKVRIDSLTGSIDSLNTFSSSVVLTSQTSSMSVLSASYAVTAAFALNAGGGGGQGTTYVHTQSSASTTWTVTHNLGERYPAIVVFDSSGNVIIPTNISAQSTSTLVVTFSSAQTGKVSATVGGGLPHISASYEGRVLAVYNDEPIWKAGIISGSQQLGNLGFATTGSNTFYGNQTISGTTTINIATLGSKCVTISSNTAIFDLGDFDGANFDYVVKNGSNMRAGMIMSAWDGSNSVYNETSTMDMGSTTGVTFTVSGLGVLNANISSGTWAVEVLYRALGCSTINPPSSPSSTNYSISTGYTAPNYCDGLFGSDQTVYGNDSAWTSVTRFYTDSGMTTPFNGGSLWFGDSTAYFGTTLQIDSNGYVIDSYAC